MSMTTFLYAADALRIEDGVTFTMTPTAPVKGVDPVVGNKNAQSVSALQGMMAGLGKRKR